MKLSHPLVDLPELEVADQSLMADPSADLLKQKGNIHVYIHHKCSVSNQSISIITRMGSVQNITYPSRLFTSWRT
jgi:hypothetical protein